MDVMTFTTPAKITTGIGALGELPDIARSLGTTALVVTGRSAMRKAGVTDRVADLLASCGVETSVFDDVEPEPSVECVDRGREACRTAACDVVLGVGGGSALDVAKAVGALAGEEATTAEFQAGLTMPEMGLPIVAIPTTSGTGSEATKNSVLSNHQQQIKKSIRGDRLLPRAVILDPELTVSVPPYVTACTGMDALTQAIESFTSMNGTPITDSMAIHSFRLLARSLVRSVECGDDVEARADTAYGSLLAGLALATARLGVVHGLAHPLGVRYGIPHGLVCGVLLPGAIKLNREAAAEKYALLSEIVGCELLEYVEKLLVDVGLPTSLAEHRIPEGDFAGIIAESMPSGSLKANAKKVTEADLEVILKDVC